MAFTEIYEYATTYGFAHPHATPDNPDPPEGSGWQLVCMAAHGGYLYWSWKRLVPTAPRVGRRTR